MNQNHPHQNVYFSSTVNLFGGRKGFERDYWQLSIKQALEWLIDNKNGELHVIIDDHYYSPELTYSDFNHPQNSSLIFKQDMKKKITDLSSIRTQ
jgi:hypothetical protein